MKTVCLEDVGHDRFYELMDQHGVEAYRDGESFNRVQITRAAVSISFSGGAALEVFIDIPDEAEI